MSPRRIVADHSHGDVDFEAEERVFFMFSSANRDEKYFSDPERFDTTRDTGAALTFEPDHIFCAGAAASRSLVGDVAIPKIFERLHRTPFR